MQQTAEHPCPLCGSHDSTVKERIPSRDIAALYERTFSIDVASEFEGVPDVDYLRCNDCGLHFFTPAVAGGNAFYTALQQFDWYYSHDKYEFSYCARLIRPGSRVLDIGCGSGNFSSLLNDVEYVGLEPNLSPKENSGIAPTIHRMEVDTFLAAAPEPFDAVCAFQVLEHLARPGDFIRSLLSCLKPGGMLYLSTPSLDSFLRHVTNSPLALPPHHMTHWPDSAFRCMASLGLELTALHHEPLQDIHVPWFCEKLYQYQQQLARPNKYKKGQVDLSPAFRELEARSMEKGPELAAVFQNPEWRPAGHTVIAIFTKTDRDESSQGHRTCVYSV
ncbi:MAG: class I SAM-dependent methyltransferase [Desulfovibrionaceae bacterium]|nr:class I SAM-dependent methyltransferase [Desulfovibrionaceae bacterium]